MLTWRHLWKLLIWIDRCFNVLLGGHYDETMSARAWRMKLKDKPYWRHAPRVIDAIFFWQDHHCQTHYEAEYAAALVKEART